MGEHLVAVNLSAEAREIGFTPTASGEVTVVLAWDDDAMLVDATTVRLGPESAVVLGPPR